MPRGNAPQSKVHYRGKEEDFVIYIDDVESVQKWKEDRSIPLARVVNGFKIFITHKHGAQNAYDAASKATLENEFGTSNQDECMTKILETGVLQNTEGRETKQWWDKLAASSEARLRHQDMMVKSVALSQRSYALMNCKDIHRALGLVTLLVLRCNTAAMTLQQTIPTPVPVSYMETLPDFGSALSLADKIQRYGAWLYQLPHGKPSGTHPPVSSFMNSASQAPDPGGFLQPTLPSPPASSINSPPTGNTILPRPRSSPLRPGSAKESSVIDYVDRQLLGISRRYEKRFNADIEDEATSGIQGRGYEGYGELARDLEGVIDVVWMSGTPSLQTPYLLTIALTSCSCLSPFPFSPRPTFHLLHKLDVAFYSLLQGTNAETGETLPGFEGGRGKLSTTEKVRLKGLVERTRVAVVDVAAKGGSVTDNGAVSRSDIETEDDFTTDHDEDDGMEGMQLGGNHGTWEMEVARVYEKTIVELGVSLDASGMGGFG